MAIIEMLLLIAAVMWVVRKTEAVTFKFLRANAVVIIIFVGMLLSGLSVVPSEHEVYTFFLGGLWVKICIALVIQSIDMSSLLKVPKKGLFYMSVGAIGTFLGALAASTFGFEQLAAQLGASYVGGGENAVAMKNMLNIPEELFIASFSVDNIITAFWLLGGCLMLSAKKTSPVPSKESEDLSDGYEEAKMDTGSICTIIFGVIASILLAKVAHARFGYIHEILFLTVFSMIIGNIPGFKKDLKNSYPIGAACFLPFFFCVGVICDISVLAKVSSVVIFQPFIVVGVHGLFILLVVKIMKEKDFRWPVVASQLLIGGPASAIASSQSIEWREGAVFGSILGVAAYGVGNFVGVGIYNLSQYFGA